MAYVCTALGAYLLGSIPTGFLVAKARGVDITKAGSGNIGATNAFRVLGKTAGTLVLLVDALKGFLAVFLAERFGHELSNLPTDQAVLFAIAGGFGAILGHNYPCWLKFKGGKGVATTAVVLLALMPWTLAVALGVWLVLLALTRYVSVASIAGAAALPVAAFIFPYPIEKRIVACLMAALAIYKHKTNIQRLLSGTENRFGAKKTDDTKGGSA
ncbi:MAG: glycerol-3-phosphate 1-O-acyltransferase PlsY [Verrucomicrobia bacterium]|nr:glycerol-3-phosphate 1-O-acyltransferase PlsY [Verrucomicrobiota bacterium]